MIGIGEGLAFFGTCTVVAVGIFKFKKNGNVTQALCDERSSGIKGDIRDIKDTQLRIFDRIDDLVEGHGKMKRISDDTP